MLLRTVFPGEPSQVTVISREEVVAGKLAALLDRAAPRDLFDMAERGRLNRHMCASPAMVDRRLQLPIIRT